MRIPYKPVRRRKFLKAGLTGGTILAFLPLERFISASYPLLDVGLKFDLNFPEESLEKLIELNHEYGSEFGEVEV